MSKNSTGRKKRRSGRSKETTISSPRAAGAEDGQSDTDEVVEGGGFAGVIAPISPVSVSADYERLSLAEIKQNIERITWGARIGTPFWGPGGRLWIPLRDAELDQEVRQALKSHGFTVYDGTHKIGKLSRRNQVGFIVCLPPGKTATRIKHGGQAGSEKSQSQRRALDVAKIHDELYVIRSSIEDGEEDYERVRKENPNFLTFKVAQKSPRRRDQIMSLPDRIGRLLGFAQDLAADFNHVSLHTIKRDWKLHKPPKYRRSPALPG